MKTAFLVLIALLLGWAAGWKANDYWDTDNTESAPVTLLANDPRVANSPTAPKAASTATTVRDELVLLLANEHYASAVEHRLTSIKRNPSIADELRWVLLEHAERLIKNNQLEDASQLLANYIERDYDDVIALRKLAKVQQARQDYEAAIRTLYAWRTHGHDVATIDDANQRLRETVKQYTITLQEPADPERLHNLYAYLTTQEPDFAPYQLRLAQIYLDMGDFTAAEQTVNLVVHDPTVKDEAYTLLSKIEHKQRRPRQIPLKRLGNQFIVYARLQDSHEVALLIDTGASITTVSHATIDLIGMSLENVATQHVINTANGPVQAPIVRLGEIAIDEYAVYETEVGVLDLPNLPDIDGLLGMNFLNKFDFVLDHSESVLYLAPLK